MARQVARVALLDCEDASKWSDHLDVWRDALAGDGAPSSGEELEWTRYRACQGELPTPAVLDSLDAIVVPGWHYSAVVPANGQHPLWMQATMDLIRVVVARGHPQLFGACFGHQLLATALGGRVCHGETFVFKAETIELQAQSWRDWVVQVSAVWHAPAYVPQTSSLSLRHTCCRHGASHARKFVFRSLACAATWQAGDVYECSRAMETQLQTSHLELSRSAAPPPASMKCSVLATACCRFKGTPSFRWRCYRIEFYQRYVKTNDCLLPKRRQH